MEQPTYVHNRNTRAWVVDPSALVRNPLDIFPFDPSLSTAERINSVTRLIIYIMIVATVLMKSWLPVIIGTFLLATVCGVAMFGMNGLMDNKGATITGQPAGATQRARTRVARTRATTEEDAPVRRSRVVRSRALRSRTTVYNYSPHGSEDTDVNTHPSALVPPLLTNEQRQMYGIGFVDPEVLMRQTHAMIQAQSMRQATGHTHEAQSTLAPFQQDSVPLDTVDLRIAQQQQQQHAGPQQPAHEPTRQSTVPTNRYARDVQNAISSESEYDSDDSDDSDDDEDYLSEADTEDYYVMRRQKHNPAAYLDADSDDEDKWNVVPAPRGIIGRDSKPLRRREDAYGDDTCGVPLHGAPPVREPFSMHHEKPMGNNFLDMFKTAYSDNCTSEVGAVDPQSAQMDAPKKNPGLEQIVDRPNLGNDAIPGWGFAREVGPVLEPSGFARDVAPFAAQQISSYQVGISGSGPNDEFPCQPAGHHGFRGRILGHSDIYM